MAGRLQLPDESDLEIWEITVEGTIYVWVYDRRNDNYTKQRISGRSGGSRRLTITVGDRRYNQEMTIDEMRPHDPFSNGALRRISGPDPTEDDLYLTLENHKTNEDLIEFFALTDADMFEEAVRDVASETILRRLHSLAQSHALAWQLPILRDVIDERYSVGGTQKTVAEMIAANDMQGGMALS